ncbi:MAG: efflux RND transporter permease subunit [Pirellulales bacterium]|nr:efflux RND transporter permease subunit [Pirellulales bacterium]
MTDQLPEKQPLLTRIVDVFLRGDVAILLTIVSIIMGIAALMLTAREEEPQIVVPMADVFVSTPGMSAVEVERKVTTRLEKLLYQIDGVEYVYSMSRPGQSIVTVRFYVGENRERSLVRLYNKIHSSVDQIPPGVEAWVVKPVEVDDVAIVNLTLWSERPEQYGDHELRRIAEQLENELQAIPDTNRVWVIGGRPRRIRIELDPSRLAARRTSVLQVAQALRAANVNLPAGKYTQQDSEIVAYAGSYVGDSQELNDLVIRIADDRPVYLKDVARVIDGPAEVDSYSWIGFGPAAKNPRSPIDTAVNIPRPQSRRSNNMSNNISSNDPTPATVVAGRLDENAISPGVLFPAVNIAVAKQKGANAVRVAKAVEERIRELAVSQLPDGVYYRITRDYGETADLKVNELVEALIIAVLTVIGLIGLIVGWRSALVVALAIPVCYSVTLMINLMVGYTINRVTLFALILALGLLVDDPITDVENIARYFALRLFPPRQAVLRAIQEVRPALILSTLAIIVSFLPLMFITGMMGPYMAPMALNVPLTIIVSTFVSFMITPWMAMTALGRIADEPGEPFDIHKSAMYRISRWVLGPILDRRLLAWGVLAAVALLFFVAVALPAFRLVPLKMLPYDNKNEFQVVIDMPEGATLEQTDAAARSLGAYLSGVAEVKDYEIYSGLASAMDFNGLVRHYFLREGPNVADIRVNLVSKKKRVQQSHEILLRIRDDLETIAEQYRANVKLVESPPGPPVISTITAEVYGPDHADYGQLIRAAERVQRRLAREPGVADVDSSAEADQPKVAFVADQPKAALSDVTKENIARTMQLALDGLPVSVLHLPDEVDPLWIELRLPRELRSSVNDLSAMYVVGDKGQLVQIDSLGDFVAEDENGRPLLEDKTIYHKNLRRVVYVYGEVAGRPPADAIIDMQFDRAADGTDPRPAEVIRPVSERTWLSPGGDDPWALPAGFTVNWAGEGEWKITLDVFRDLGIAFAAALVGIFVILMFETRSRALPLIIMLAIPLTMIGIMPGFWLLNVLVDRPVGGYPTPVFFTATAMIGMIALAGIVVRNSVVLIDFIHHGKDQGLELREAVIQSVAIRTRPIVLTAGTALLGNWVITLDPIFSGLAWAIIFGIFTSTVFSLLVVPVVYWLLFSRAAR